jgi:hypothetical protein
MLHETFHRHDVLANAQKTIKQVAPPVVCESCGKVLPTHANAYNMWFNSGIGVPGGPELHPISCDAGEHWACSLDCWQVVAHACVEVHMFETLKQAHAALEERRLAYEKEITGNDRNS